MSYQLVQGNTDPDMEIDVTNPDGSVLNLTGAQSIAMSWWLPDGTFQSVPLVAIDLSNGKLKRVWSTGDTDVPGLHLGRVEIIDANSKPVTYPNGGKYVQWFVYPKRPPQP